MTSPDSPAFLAAAAGRSSRKRPIASVFSSRHFGSSTIRVLVVDVCIPSRPSLALGLHCCRSATRQEPLNQSFQSRFALRQARFLIPDDLDSTRCQQSRTEDLEHLQAATKSPNKLLGDRIARAV